MNYKIPFLTVCVSNILAYAVHAAEPEGHRYTSNSVIGYSERAEHAGLILSEISKKLPTNLVSEYMTAERRVWRISSGEGLVEIRIRDGKPYRRKVFTSSARSTFSSPAMIAMSPTKDFIFHVGDVFYSFGRGRRMCQGGHSYAISLKSPYTTESVHEYPIIPNAAPIKNIKFHGKGVSVHYKDRVILLPSIEKTLQSNRQKSAREAKARS